MIEEHSIVWEDVKAYLEENRGKMNKADWERVANDVDNLSFEDKQRAQVYFSTFSKEYMDEVKEMQLKEISGYSEDYIDQIRQKQLEEEEHYKNK